MMTRGTSMVGYNVQAAAEAKHHPIVTRGRPTPASTAINRAWPRVAMGNAMLSKRPPIADTSKSEEILSRHEAGITTFVPKPRFRRCRSGSLGRDFILRHSPERKRRLAGERLDLAFYDGWEKGLKPHRY